MVTLVLDQELLYRIYLLANDCSGNPVPNVTFQQNNCSGNETTTQSCDLSCSAGYATDGQSMTVTCQSDGNYSAPAATCNGNIRLGRWLLKKHSYISRLSIGIYLTKI